jgi:hypothetical protein
MKGQMTIDEFLNISEEEQANKKVKTRPIIDAGVGSLAERRKDGE